MHPVSGANPRGVHTKPRFQPGPQDYHGRHPRTAVTEAHQLALSVLRKRGLLVRPGTSVSAVASLALASGIRTAPSGVNSDATRS